MNQQTEEALRMAIEAMEGAYRFDGIVLGKAINACKAALEKPNMTYEQGFAHGYEAHRAETALETELSRNSKQLEQEPVAWVEYMYEEDKNRLLTPYKNLLDYDNGNCIPLYTKPTKRLSDDKKLLIIRKWAENNTMRGQELIGLCDAIEKAHGIGE
jgi:hypothetical protein